jgi:hypothetical protein
MSSTTATAVLAALEERNVHATLGDPEAGTVTLAGPGLPNPKAEALAAKYAGPLRGELTHRHYLATDDPAHWCNRCGAEVKQYDPDGTAWCDQCVCDAAAAIVLAGIPGSVLDDPPPEVPMP